jgi:hypothetical protein
MFQKHILLAATVILLTIGYGVVSASPPAVGMASNSKSCISCHANTGPWQEGASLILDILDKSTMASLRQPDGSFQINCKRGQTASVITVLGYQPQENLPVPHRNGWIFVDTTLIGTPAVSKFAAGWEADIIYGCKIVGDKSALYPDAAIATAPLTIRPLESAKDADISLQVLMTAGEAVKNKPKEGLQSNYFIRTVRLRVVD